MARKIHLTSRAAGSLAAVLALALPVVGILVGCGGGGGGVTSPNPRPGQPTIPSSDEFLALLPPAQQSATLVGSQACAQCHGGSPASRPTPGPPPLTDVHTSFNATKHAQVGVGCESCHGPGSDHMTNPAGNKLGIHGGVPASVLCTQCHDFEQSPDFLYTDKWKLIEHGREK